MKGNKKYAHFTHKYLLDPTNPISVHLIGAGGTGSQVLTALARMNHALLALEHPGLDLTVFDDDTVTAANLGRQLFAQTEIGLHKATALINRVNRFFATDWKARVQRYALLKYGKVPQETRANIIISCVDSASARFGIAELLEKVSWTRSGDYRNRMYYWLDFGNLQKTGQVLLGTLSEITQPASKKFCPVGELPTVTEEFDELLRSQKDRNIPSCSLADALLKQDLFINATLAQMGCSLLWNMLRQGYTEQRGFFLNLADFRAQPVPVAPPK